jgi:asparagine synthase (glutamine-hydrolysing)
MLPEALKAIDHPSGDGPNSYVVSKVTRDYGITMALSGLGGDELFAGYPVFKRVMKVMRNSWIWSLPLPLRKMAGNAFAGMKPGIQGLKIRQLLSMPEVNPGNLQILSRQTQTPDEIAKLFNFEPPADKLYPALDEMIGKAGKLGALSQVGIAEIVTYMQNILLRDTDQMSMASALEVRVPFLDYKLVEYVLGVGDAFKNPVYPKKLLADSLSDLVPSEIVHRKKMGFSFPWKHWMKGELKQFCDERIRSLAARSFINGKVLTETWRKFLSDDPRVRWHDLWIAVVLENWMQENNIEN